MDYNAKALKFSVAPDDNGNSFMAGQPISNLSLPKLQGGFLCCYSATSHRRDQILGPVAPVSNSLAYHTGLINHKHFLHQLNEVRSVSPELGKQLLVNSLPALTEGPGGAGSGETGRQPACRCVLGIWGLVWDLDFKRTGVLKWGDRRPIRRSRTMQTKQDNRVFFWTGSLSFPMQRWLHWRWAGPGAQRDHRTARWLPEDSVLLLCDIGWGVGSRASTTVCASLSLQLPGVVSQLSLPELGSRQEKASQVSSALCTLLISRRVRGFL